MKVIIHCSDDVEYTIKDFDHFTIMEFLEALNDAELQFIQLDIEGDQVLMNKARIIQVVIKKEAEDVRST